MEFLQTGNVRRIQFEDNERSKVCSLLRGIYGVGLKIANLWYDKGVRSLEDIEQGKGDIALTEAQKVKLLIPFLIYADQILQIGLRYYYDLQERMSRKEASEIFEKVRKTGRCT